MISRRFVKRLAQAASLLALGLWLDTASISARTYEVESCPGQGCGYCPADWHGSCVTFGVSCAEFGCYDDGMCGQSVQQCYCPPC